MLLLPVLTLSFKLNQNIMELDTFITETLVSIIKGVSNAQDFSKQDGARINRVRAYHKNGFE
ncbi:hypothetical protein BUE76_00760 [Cnuella takakiae]|nr:hypothetical protein BUE76_00760 [Cnuella takakiae]